MGHLSLHSLIAASWALSNGCCDAFTLPALFPKNVFSSVASSRLFSQVAPAKPKNDYAPYSLAEVAEAQAAAEARARAVFDPHAMNALFINIDERPDPISCAISSDSASFSLPPDMPPGCLLRIGPNGASTDEGFLDGDGMVHCITLPPPGKGKIMYSATYVDTKARKLEREVGTGDKFAGVLGTAPRGLPMLGNLLKNGLTFGTFDVQKDTCNTALAVSGGRILALMEQAPPTEIEISKGGRMRTLESFARLDGAVPPAPITGGQLGAHGRTCPVTNERIHISYQSAFRPFIRVDTFAEDWKLTSSVGVDVPAPVMVHDVAITQKYVVILDFPLTVRPRRFLSNTFPVEYEPENGARIGLMPRSASEDETEWFDVKTGVVLHAANAYERDDGKVVVHAFKSIPSADSSFILEYTPSFLYEWILDPSTGKTVAERCLCPNLLVEFPQVEEGVVGQKASVAYGLVSTAVGGPTVQFKTPKSAVTIDSFVKFALEENKDKGYVAGDVVGRYDFPQGWHSVSEPTIVTKVNGDGHYVLQIASYVPPASDGEDHIKIVRKGGLKSQFFIFDGEDISNGPVTTVDLPHFINYGLHSEFVSWDVMK